MIKPLNLFYEEPDPDRWIKFDRYPRRIIRRLIRGKEPIGGVQRWFVNLCHGLDKVGIPYSINNYKILKKYPHEWALVIGKPQILAKIPSTNPVIYGPGIASHPLDDSFYYTNNNIKHLLISSLWFKDMYDRDLSFKIKTSLWPSGIDTELWKPVKNKKVTNKYLVYDKVRWDRDVYQSSLINKIIDLLNFNNIDVELIQYGFYKEEDFCNKLDEVDAMIFLCEHETQGFAYLQALAKDIPILAWDRGGYWQDPNYYPHKVKYKPVSSVPYWDERCGIRFSSIANFESELKNFCQLISENKFKPRSYILEKLTLEKCALRYSELVQQVMINEL